MLVKLRDVSVIYLMSTIDMVIGTVLAPVDEPFRETGMIKCFILMWFMGADESVMHSCKYLGPKVRASFLYSMKAGVPLKLGFRLGYSKERILVNQSINQSINQNARPAMSKT
jgi:hypothetical protein